MGTLPKDSIAGFLMANLPAWWVTVLIIYISLFKTVKAVHYYTKITIYYVLILVIALLLLPYSMLRPFRPENYGPLMAIVPLITRYLFQIDAEVIGKEHLQSDKPYILLLNHQSSIDAFMMFYVWPPRCVSLMKRELIKIFPFGTTAWLCGSIFIDRHDPNAAKDTLKQAADDLVNNNVKICMYPEGTRNRDGHMLPFKKGAFNLAVQAQVPLVPAVISSYRHFYNAKEKKFGSGKVTITVLPPVPTVGLTRENVLELTERVRDSMVEVFERQQPVNDKSQ